tara:strand:- start:2538 stop:3617 length:1080 start_codon:yes stop_codon:yes gene_type:complete
MSFNGRDDANMKRPAPSSGFGDFPRVGVHAAQHSHSNAPPGPRVMAPSVRNNVFQLAANPSATYPLFCGAFTNGWQQGYQEGMPLFTNMQHLPGQNRPTRSLTGRHSSHNILASIPVLNFYLTIGSFSNDEVQKFVKNHQLNKALIPHYPSDDDLLKRAVADGALTPAQTLGDLDDDAKEYLKDTMYVEDFMAKWRLAGVIVSDMDISSRYQKLFNLNVRGRCRVFNLWTTRKNGLYERRTARDRVQKNDTLFLTLKKVPIDDNSYRQPDGTTMASIFIPPEGRIWQIRAERMTHGEAPFPERSGDSVYPEVKLQIEVGKVLNALSKKPDEHFQSRAFREHTQMVCLPMLEIGMHLGQL